MPSEESHTKYGSIEGGSAATVPPTGTSQSRINIKAAIALSTVLVAAIAVVMLVAVVMVEMSG